MTLKNDYPPNIERIRAVLPIKPGFVFTYGDTIYAPGVPTLPPTLLEHEEVHSRQQAKLGPDKWWKKYLTDSQFRLSQEIEAYRVQYEAACSMSSDRDALARFLFGLALDLSGEMYGRLMSHAEAMKAIRGSCAMS